MSEKMKLPRLHPLPKDQDNWTGQHAEVRIERAKVLFEKYEQEVNFNWPKEKIDNLYRPYLLAREEAIEVATVTNWRKQEAESLP